MKTVYLAGPISGLNYQGCNDWREGAIKYLEKHNIKGISPMRAKKFLEDEKEIKDSYKHPLASEKGITTRDRFDVSSCDIMLVNLLGAKRVSIGTCIEYGWADAFRKPIITITEKKGNPHEHSIIRELTGFRVETIKEGLEIAVAILA